MAELTKALQRCETQDKMIGQLKGEIAKYKEVQEDHAQDLMQANVEIKRRDQLMAEKDTVIKKLRDQIIQMKTQFENELKKARKISGVTNGLNSSIMHSEASDPFSSLTGSTLKGGK
jgi:predicted  nucleic acid-binding Zn-ribbon protein